MDENKFVLNKLLYKYDYLESYMEEVKYKYSKYNTQFLKEYYELNPQQQKEIITPNNSVNDNEDENEYTTDEKCETNVKEDEKNEDETDIKDDEKTEDKTDIKDDEKNKDETDIKDDEISENEDPILNEILNKLYKKLSLKTHPDKHGGNNELFIEMLDAYKKKNMLKLIKMSHKLDIDYVLSDILISYIEKDISDLENKINELQHHVCWLWCNADENTKKKFKLP